MAVEGISGVSAAATAATVAPKTVVAPAPQVSATASTPRIVEQPEAELRSKTQTGVQDSAQNAAAAVTTNEKVKKAVEQLNSSLGKTECRYSFHDDTNRVMIRLVDKETEEVIKEFPAEETLNMIAKAWELAGLLVDERL